MPQERLPMRKIRDVLRLRATGMSTRQVAASLSVSKTTVQNCLRRAEAVGLGWPLPDELTDEVLEARLYPPPQAVPEDRRPLPGWATIHRELKRPGVTLQLLWEEHRGRYPDGHGYSRFCELYRAWARKLSPTMRQTHTAGDKLFVDYAGTTIEIFDGMTGEVRTCQLFVAALGASSYTYAEATWTQTLPDWIGAHVRTFEFLGGVTALTVSDNLKSGITSRRSALSARRPASTSRPSTARTPRWPRTIGRRSCRRGPTSPATAVEDGFALGEVRGGRAAGDTLDHRQAAQCQVLLAGRSERCDP
jgi:transposase